MAQANRRVAPARLPSGKDRLTVIIPAAGIGRRMKSRGPKALLSVVHGMSVLEIQIRNIQTVYPTADIIVVSGFECNKIRNMLWETFEARIVCNPNYNTTNVTYGISLGLDVALPGNVIVIHGDLVFNTSAIEELAGKESSLLVDTNDQFDKEEVGIGTRDNYVTGLYHGLDKKWAQMAFFTGKELRMLRAASFNHDLSSQWFLYEVINHIIQKKGRFIAIENKYGSVIEIDKIEDLKKAKSVLN